MPFKVTKFGNNQKLICDFLLVINSNLYHILHHFRDKAFERSQNCYIWLPLLRKVRDGQGTKWCRNIADRQSDGRTEKPSPSSHLHNTVRCITCSQTEKIYEQNKSENSYRLLQIKYSIPYLLYIISEKNTLVTILISALHGMPAWNSDEKGVRKII